MSAKILYLSEFKAARRRLRAVTDERDAQLAARKAARSGHVSDSIPVDWARLGVSPALLTADPDEAA